MYNLRYHIASLVAVFLALSVGLVLGSIVVERGTIDRQQAALVRSLQKDFVRINAENRVLGAQVSASEEFANALVPQTTQGLLEGRTILVLTNAGRTDGLSSAVNAIEDAGGRAAIAMLQEQGLSLDKPSVSSAATAVLGDTVSTNELDESVAASLTAEWTGTGPRQLVDALVEAQAIRMENMPSDTPADGFVVLASWDSEADPLTLKLAALARDRGRAVVGAQAFASSTRVAATFADEGFDSVNDLGTPRGEYSLALLLAGRATGSYGVGPAVDGPFPPVPAQPSK